MAPLGLAFASRALSIAIGLVLVAAAFDKLRDWPAFRAAVANYRLLPSTLVVPFSLILPLVEAAAGIGLLVEATLGIATNVVRGRVDIDCGCGGVEGRQRLSWALVMRNAVLVVLLGVGAAVDSPPLFEATLGVTLVVSALAFVALFAAASQLVANRPLLNELANRP
jgi:methylamine utilization protein MauE